MTPQIGVEIPIVCKAVRISPQGSLSQPHLNRGSTAKMHFKAKSRGWEPEPPNHCLGEGA